jgi:uncharacterized protein
LTRSDPPEQVLLFVDTNVFLRFLTSDVPDQAGAVERLFLRAAAGDLQLVTNTMVLTELVWVLESYYRLSRPQVVERVMAVASMDGLVMPDSDIVADALFAYADSNVDFADAYNACWMKSRGLDHVATLDVKHYSRFEGFKTYLWTQ